MHSFLKETTTKPQKIGIKANFWEGSLIFDIYNTVMPGKNQGEICLIFQGSVRISWLCLTVVSKTWVYTFRQKFSVGSWVGQSHPIRKSILEMSWPYWPILVTILQHRIGLAVQIFVATCQCRHLSDHRHPIVWSWPSVESWVSTPTSKVGFDIGRFDGFFFHGITVMLFLVPTVSVSFSALFFHFSASRKADSSPPDGRYQSRIIYRIW